MKREWRIGAALFAAAVILYLPGVWWGLPNATAPERVQPWGSDELGPLGPVSELYSVFIARPDSPRGFRFNPQYPLFHYGVQALAVGPYLGWLWLTGGLARPGAAFPYGLADPVTSLAMMTLLTRLVSLLMAAAIGPIAWWTASRLWGRRAGITAGMLALLVYPMFYYGRTSNVDVPALFWTALGLAVAADALRASLDVRRAIWLGVLAALATATKDASYAAFLPIGAALAIRHLTRSRREGAGWLQAAKAPLAGAAAGLVVYLVASGFVFDQARFWAHVRFIRHGSIASQGVSYGSTPATLAGYMRVLGETGQAIVDAVGVPMLAAAVAGVAIAAARVPSSLVLLLAAAGTIAGVILPVRFVMFRFVMVVAYVLALFAGRALGAALDAPRPAVRRLGYVLLVLVCGWSAARGADLTHQMINDSRYRMAAWLREHAQPGQRIGYFGSHIKLPRVDRAVALVPMPGQIGPVFEGIGDVSEPEFVVVIPQQPFEPEHEYSLPEGRYRELLSGAGGYRLVFSHQTPSWWARRPVSFVNPPVKIFVRADLSERLVAGQEGSSGHD